MELSPHCCGVGGRGGQTDPKNLTSLPLILQPTSPSPPNPPLRILSSVSSTGTNFPGQNRLSWPRFSWIQPPQRAIRAAASCQAQRWQRLGGRLAQNPPKTAKRQRRDPRCHRTVIPKSPLSRAAKGAEPHGGLETWSDGHQGARRETCQAPRAGRAQQSQPPR